MELKKSDDIVKLTAFQSTVQHLLEKEKGSPEKQEESLVELLDGKKVESFYTERKNPQQWVLEKIVIEEIKMK